MSVKEEEKTRKYGLKSLENEIRRREWSDLLNPTKMLVKVRRGQRISQ